MVDTVRPDMAGLNLGLNGIVKSRVRSTTHTGGERECVFA